MNTLKHYIPSYIVNAYNPVNVLLVGAGGTGSQLITGLARINYALKLLGNPGINLTVADGDTVSTSNVGRQLFSPADVGKNKAVVLVNRVNMFFGTCWESFPHDINDSSNINSGNANILISAIDSPQSRFRVHSIGKRASVPYWIDTGNTANSGQVIMGTLTKVKQPDKSCPDYLPNVLDLYGDILEEEAKKAYQGPSCSVADALAKQDLFVNQWVATSALEIIWDMFRHGYIATHGAFINLRPLAVRPLPVNPAVWEAMGWKAMNRKTKLKSAA